VEGGLFSLILFNPRQNCECDEKPYPDEYSFHGGYLIMKRLLTAIFFVLLLTASPALAIVTYNVDYLTGGNARALDYISVNDLNNGDRAIAVYTSGATPYYLYFKYDSSGVTAEQTSSHPYYIRPNDFSASGVWYEVGPSWVYLNTDLTIANLTVTGTNNVNNLDASGRISGRLPITDIASGTVTLSGISLYGGVTHNYQANSEVTAYVSQCLKGMSAVFNLAKGISAGSTMWVTFAPSQKIINKNTFVCGTTAGTSYYYLSGTTGSGISLVSVAENVWYVYEDGAPTQESR
jgi:hypothetical protein